MVRNFAYRLREVRKKRGLTQKQLAELLGITKSAVGNYELGISNPKEEVMLKMFDVLDVEPNYMFQDSCKTISRLLSLEENEIIEAYTKATFKDKNMARMSLDLPPLKVVEDEFTKEGIA